MRSHAIQHEDDLISQVISASVDRIFDQYDTTKDGLLEFSEAKSLIIGMIGEKG